MHLPRKWINSDLIYSRLLLFFFFLNTSNPNPKPYAVDDHRIDQKTVIRRDRLSLIRHLVMFSVVFMIVAIAVGTKRLAFVITVSAFVLIVLEYVGSLSYSMSNRVQFFLRSCFPLLAPSLPFKRDEKCQSQGYGNVSSKNLCETSDDGSSEYATSSGEIGIFRHISRHVDDIIVTKQNVIGETKIGGGGEEFIDAGTNEVLGMEKRRSRRAILKEKIIRRLVPKKFRHSKYSKGSEGKFEDYSTKSAKVMEGDSSVGSLTIRQVISEVESDSEECKYLHFPVGPAKADHDREQSDDLNRPSDNSLKIEADSVVFGSCHTSEPVKRGFVPSKLFTSNIQIDARGKSGYVMLVVIVLAGLVGGKILSCFLAIGYCCIFKYISSVKDSAMRNLTSTVQYTV